MNKITAIVCSITALFCSACGVSGTADDTSATTSAKITSYAAENDEYNYTVQDVQNLQDFLLTKPTNDDLSGKPYDLDNDGVWSVFDLCLMKRYCFSNQSKENTDVKMNIEINSYVLVATLADNEAAQALAELIKNEPLTLDLSEYGSFEKVGALPQGLPKSDERITTEAGDIMLYQGNQITIFYGTNTWSYTRLGKIEGMSSGELADIFGSGDVTVTLSLAE